MTTQNNFRTHLPDYPFKWEGLEDFNYPLNENGLPLVDLGPNLGLRLNPITISQFGLYNLQKYSATKEARFCEKAFVCADWLFDNLKFWRNEIGAWIYDYSLHFYGPEAPWISGMAQGQGISLLLRAHQLRPNDNTKKTTDSAFQAFLYPVKEGGVVSFFPDGAVVFEEYPTNPPSHVLNGHIFALLGVLDYAVFRDSRAAMDLFHSAIQGLVKNLHKYDCGFWNYYDLHPTKRLASPMYIKVHVQLLRILAEITGESYFSVVAKKWQACLANPLGRARWLFRKIKEKSGRF